MSKTAKKPSGKENIRFKKDYARTLFMRTDMSQKEIALLVGVSEKTLSNWANDPEEKWESLKTSFIITKGQELKRIYQQIADLNNAIEGREVGKRHATPSESDTLSKLAATAKNLETQTSITEIINVSIDYLEWLREVDFNESKRQAEYYEDFIKSKLNKS